MQTYFLSFVLAFSGVVCFAQETLQIDVSDGGKTERLHAGRPEMEASVNPFCDGKSPGRTKTRSLFFLAEFSDNKNSPDRRLLSWYGLLKPRMILQFSVSGRFRNSDDFVKQSTPSLVAQRNSTCAHECHVV